MELQDQLTIATPEGVGLTVVLADVGSRGVAYAIDITIQFVFDVLLFLGLGIAGAPSGLVLAIFVVAVFLTPFGYFTLFEAFDDGRTPGKRLIGLRGASADARGMTFWRSLVRNLLRLIDALPAVYLVGITSVLATSKNQRLGDLAADTIVVRVPRVPPAGRTSPTSAATPHLPPGPQRQRPCPWPSHPRSPPGTCRGSPVTTVNAVRTPSSGATPCSRHPPAAGPRLREPPAPPLFGGPPDTEGPERFLEWIVYAKQAARPTRPTGCRVSRARRGAGVLRPPARRCLRRPRPRCPGRGRRPGGRCGPGP